ncbi:MAG: Uma2 family endonuclease, partial [Microcystaceae cyanobacterium]
EQMLRIPYYFVFNRYTDELQAFGLVKESYQPLSLEGAGIWLEKAQLGLGLWQGNYEGVERQWLRWYDRDSQWILTPAERARQQAEQEKQLVEQERQRADSAEMEIARLKRLLEQAGVNPHS